MNGKKEKYQVVAFNPVTRKVYQTSQLYDTRKEAIAVMKWYNYTYLTAVILPVYVW